MIPELKYDEKGLIPAIVQDAENGDILMLAYMNRKSLEMTLDTGFTHFWSRSRQKYWKKGETSGHVQEVREMLYDCDADTLLVKVIQHGPAPATPETGHVFTEALLKRKRMSKYRCTVCGYIYDPEIGDPDGGIAPGTPFEEIPDNWECPVCGAPKDLFEKIGSI